MRLMMEASDRVEPLKVHIRWLVRRDLAEVLTIESTNAASAMSASEFVQALREGHNGMVAEAGGRVVGFMIYELTKARLDLVNFAVDVCERRRGVGSQLMAKLKLKLSAERRNLIELLVRESNLGGQLFLRACGFQAVDIFHRHYETEDAYRMRYRVDQPAADEIVAA